ncbi:hypothetical protein FQR65_LT09051, partial [Abscondita terminalis]
SYKPNYFSIEDILVTQERVPCKFLINVPKLGKLNPAAEENDIKPGTKLELPLWLAEPISSGRQPLISVDLPKTYRETHREILKADAVAVDLYKFGNNFYELGLYVSHLDPTGDVLKVLLHTFQTRFTQLMDLTENVVLDPTVQNRLDMLERSLFRDGHAGKMLLDNWLKNSGVPMEAAAMVLNHKKRKR